MTFPQLASGSVAQYSIQRVRRSGAARIDTPGGASIQGPASGAQSMEWLIGYRGMTGAEAGELRAFFEQCRGRLGTFLFLDPLANLLSSSEELAGSLWQKQAGVVVSAGGWDAGIRGRIHVVTNGGAGEAGIAQTVAADRERQYALSGYVRSAGGASVVFRVSAGAEAVQAVESAGTVWKRVYLPVRFAMEGTGLACGVSVHGGGSVEVCGLQLEAQQAPGVYKPSGIAGGVFPEARFGMDELLITAEDDDRFRADVMVYAEI